MAKTKTIHRCLECGTASPRWTGRCTGCGEWNTLVEEVDRPAAPARRYAAALSGGEGVAASTPVPLLELDHEEWAARSTGIDELDRVLGGGLVPGSVTLLGGEPGIGK